MLSPRTGPLILDAHARSGIYGIFNNAAGKVYIGSAVNISRRYKEHLKKLRGGAHHSPHLQRAWNKYGPAAFMFKALRYVEKEQLILQEQALIDFFQAAWDEAGYNICPVAGSCVGRRLTQSTKEKIASKHRGKRLTEEHKAAISLGSQGKWVSAETKQNMRTAQQGFGGGNAVLTAADVLRIRELATQGVTQKEIAKEFGLTRGYVSLLVTRRRWGHI